MNDLPRVSVIIPVYNSAKYLRDCLESILTQDFNEIEVICVNDGSTDSSLSILHEYEDRDDRVRVFSQINSGQGVARNFGIKKAHGEYVWFVDSDDMIRPKSLRYLYNEAQVNKLNILSTEIKVQYEDEKLKKITNEEYYTKKGKYNYISPGKKMFADMIKNNDFCVSANSLLINREWMIRKNIFFPESIFFEDAIFCLKCYYCATDMKHINYKSYIYNVRPSSTMTSKIDEKKILSWLEVFKYEIILLLKDDDILFQKALLDYIKIWYSYIRNISLKSRLIFDLDLSPQYDLLRLFLGLEKNDKLRSVYNDEKLLLLGFQKMIEDSNEVVIYGAGEIGKIIYKFLSNVKKDNAIKCFAVSNVDKNVRMINKIPVCKIDCYMNRNCLVILAANNKNQKEMLEKLHKLHINNFYVISDRLKFSIKHFLSIDL